MFNNLINYHDLTRFIWGLRHGYLRMIVSRLTKGRIGRVKDAWKTTKKAKGSTWWMIPEISKRLNKLMTGDEEVGYYKYVAGKYLSDRSKLVGLSLGCGNGHRELVWAGLCDFTRIEAYDISDNLIKQANANADEKGLGEVIDYRVGDIHKLELKENSFDVVFIEHSLHHFSPLDEVIANVRKWLKPGGIFVVNEYVGPRRFQWTKRQLEAANHVRALLPEKYRRHAIDDSVNRKVICQSRLSMILKDPSEAIESDRIIPLLNEMFEVVEHKPCYGAILHLVFESIAHNFIPMDDEGRKYFDMCLEVEDVLTDSGEVQSDYALLICRKGE